MPMRPVRALVLETHGSQRTMAINMLHELGCQEVFSASGGADALEILQKVGPVDIALCDLRLDGMDGLEFLHLAAKAGLVSSVIINSSLTEDVRRTAHRLVTMLGLVVLGDLNKPLQMDALEGLLEKHMREAIGGEGAVLRPTHLCDENEIREALRDQQLKAYFQPKVHLLSGETYGVEVLTRWHHPTKGVLPPAVFMPVLKEAGLIDELLFSQLDQSLEFQQLAWDRGHLLSIALNLEPSQLSNVELVQSVKQRLGAHRMPASGLTFELTEGSLLQATVISLENLMRLRIMGCGLSIDDFGTGFSSLQRLSHLPFTEIKLDGGFIRNLEHDPRSQIIVSSTLALGEALKLSVVVEGIETAEQYQQLLKLGCAKGQGYLFAKPMEQTHLLTWLDVQANARNVRH
ncbi:EAL domain-containing protein [Pseudomonas edaphica]|uniref:EAL domain-containing protein n=1 Tax=Pseudomonas edaphica TaxID=2006980 RepID=A0ABY2UCN1_9PSED|nr:EAL domain-containing response regulator [Pseudomonas edaphica]TLG94107.1 EAL domain-containing protein [Pseudomonas edaphica]